MKQLSMAANKHIYLVRHGLATLDPQGYGDRKLTAGLIPGGVRAIGHIARFLKDVPASFNVSSDVPRCRETAAIITRITGKVFIFDKRLTEFHRETFAEFLTRVESFTRDLSRIPQDNIVVCSHSAVITGIKDLLTKGAFAYEKEYDYPKEGELVIVHKGESRTLNFNS